MLGRDNPWRRQVDGSGNACKRGAPTLYGSASNGQQVLLLPPHKKGYIPSEGRVGGCKTATPSFDGDGIQRLLNTELKYLVAQSHLFDLGLWEGACELKRNGGIISCKAEKKGGGGGWGGSTQTEDIMIEFWGMHEPRLCENIWDNVT